MGYPYVQARHYTRTNGRTIDVIVIHTMEAAEKGNTAEAVANYFATTDRKASAHYNVDADSIVQCVRDQDVAYHAPGNNHNGLGIEHAGTAHQGVAEWNDDYSKAMLARSAKLAAELAAKYKIPLVWLTPADLRAGKRGFTSHNNVSQAWGKSKHWDPGPNFPVDAYLKAVAEGGAELDYSTPKQWRAEDQYPSKGEFGPRTRDWQQKMADIGYDIKVDSYFGDQTHGVTIHFQSQAGLKPDGIVGPKTLEAYQRRVAPQPAPAPAAPAPRRTGWFKANHPLLREGSRGNAVKHAQRAVGAGADGIFGPNTERAVVAAQRRWGISADGIVGPETWAAMHPVIRNGSRGETVTEVQNELGIPSDGVFGPQTEHAVKEHQKAKGLSVDGIVGPNTYKSLF